MCSLCYFKEVSAKLFKVFVFPSQKKVNFISKPTI